MSSCPYLYCAAAEWQRASVRLKEADSAGFFDCLTVADTHARLYRSATCFSSFFDSLLIAHLCVCTCFVSPAVTFCYDPTSHYLHRGQLLAKTGWGLLTLLEALAGLNHPRRYP